MLGIAKLLLLMGSVNREIPYVVSLAMTGLMRGYDVNFHTRDGFHSGRRRDNYGNVIGLPATISVRLWAGEALTRSK